MLAVPLGANIVVRFVGVMLTLVDKPLLVKLFYISGESSAEVLQKFWAWERTEKCWGPITLARLQSSMKMQGNQKFKLTLQRKASTVVLQMNPLVVQSTNSISSAWEVAWTTGIRKINRDHRQMLGITLCDTKNVWILYPLWCVKLVFLWAVISTSCY